MKERGNEIVMDLKQTLELVSSLLSCRNLDKLGKALG